MSTIKIYNTTCYRKQTDGSLRQIQVNRKYSTKAPRLSPEQIKDIQQLFQSGVTKKKLCERFGVPLYIINRAIV